MWRVTLLEPFFLTGLRFTACHQSIRKRTGGATGEGGASSGIEDGDVGGGDSGVEKVVGAVWASVCSPLSAGMSVFSPSDRADVAK